MAPCRLDFLSSTRNRLRLPKALHVTEGVASGKVRKSMSTSSDVSFAAGAEVLSTFTATMTYSSYVTTT